MKHTRKCKHIRTSKRGRRFPAGRGAPRMRGYSMDPLTFEQMKKVTKEQEFIPMERIKQKPKRFSLEELGIRRA